MSSGLRKLFTEQTKFSELRPRILPMADLQHWAHWAEDFDGNLTRTMKAIEDGNNFFTTANFQLFAYLVRSDAIKAQLRSLQVSDIGSHRPATAHPQPKLSSTPKGKPKSNLSLRELRRLTGNKKAR
jgi:hypothetical protein